MLDLHCSIMALFCSFILLYQGFGAVDVYLSSNIPNLCGTELQYTPPPCMCQRAWQSGVLPAGCKGKLESKVIQHVVVESSISGQPCCTLNLTKTKSSFKQCSDQLTKASPVLYQITSFYEWWLRSWMEWIESIFVLSSKILLYTHGQKLTFALYHFVTMALNRCKPLWHYCYICVWTFGDFDE